MTGKGSEAKVAPKDLPKEIEKVEKEMRKAAKALNFERAAELRNRLVDLKKQQILAP